MPISPPSRTSSPGQARPSQDRPQSKQQRKVYKNDEIKAFKVLIITEEWEKVGPYPRERALQMAQDANMDLVQVGYNAEEKVATAKIIDFGKYMYDKKKNESEKKKTQKQKWQKEIKFGYNISEHDLELKIKKAHEFLLEWYVVKVMVVLRWREKAYRDIVRAKIEVVEHQLQDVAKPQWIKDEVFWFSLVLLAKK